LVTGIGILGLSSLWERARVRVIVMIMEIKIKVM